MTADSTSKDLAVAPKFTDDELSVLDSFEAAIQLFAEKGLSVDSVTDYGHGFSLLTTGEKTNLVGKPMILVEWTFNDSSKFADADGVAAEFVSVFAILKTGQKVIFNDGSTGIAAQLKGVTEKRVREGHKSPTQGLIVPMGLVASTYPYTDDKGRTSEATTYYLSESLPA